jgi:hypothetical protein
MDIPLHTGHPPISHMYSSICSKSEFLVVNALGFALTNLQNFGKTDMKNRRLKLSRLALGTIKLWIARLLVRASKDLIDLLTAPTFCAGKNYHRNDPGTFAFLE